MVRWLSSATSFRFVSERASTNQTKILRFILSGSGLNPLTAAVPIRLFCGMEPHPCLLGHTTLNLPCDKN